MVEFDEINTGNKHSTTFVVGDVPSIHPRCIPYMAIHIQSLRDFENVQYICSVGFVL
ncbi:MAG: hypothetical protein Q8M67_04350 [Bacteroidota bacterium]|nr:hypothetical protein [Bacteroidota bacterium]